MVWNAVLLAALMSWSAAASVRSADAQSPGPDAAPRVEVSIDPWSRGVSISLDGVTVSAGSNMVITKPPWTPHYYLGPDAPAVEALVTEQIDGGVRYRLIHRGEHDAFEGDDTITVSGSRVERVFEGRFNKDEQDALIQWQMAAVNPTLIVGRSYRAVLRDGQVTEGIVPVVAKSAEVEPSTLARGFRSIEFDSRIGPLRIEVDTEQNTICYDYRKNRWSDPARPMFWLGDTGSRFRKGQPVRYRVVFDLPAQATDAGGDLTSNARALVHDRPDAQAYPMDYPPLIIPRPKRATFRPGGFAVPSPLDCLQVDDPKAAAAAAELVRFFAERFGLDAAGAPDGTPTPRPKGAIVFAANTGESLPPEGYRLEITPQRVSITADDKRGHLYAVQTIKQLALRSSGGEVMVRSAAITDWPSLEFRGVHLFTGGQGPDLHLKLIRDVLAATKMNNIVLEAEYVEWDSHPEIHHPHYGMPKDEVRRILSACEEVGIEVIPLVMSLGHCQWMFETGHNLDLAEDPDAKWAYCVTNPDTYTFIFEIYQEAVDLFKPKIFHIGHDEFHHRGRVPYRESSKGYTVEELFLADTLRHHAWFAERGIKLMMWGDMLLGPGEGPDACHAESVESARDLRNKLPKDIAIADWHYVDTDPEKYTNLSTFHADGYETVAATWYRPGNITNFTKAASVNNSRGLLQTTWAGYSLDPGSFEASIGQYAAYVLAAESAWNAEVPPDPATYPSASYFFDLLGTSSLKPAVCGGWTTDLGPACTYPLAAADAGGWFGLGPDFDLSSAPSGSVRLKGLAFDLGRATGQSAVVLRGRLTGGLPLPAAVEIVLDRKADRLAILQATNFPCRAGQKVGQYLVTYDDDETVVVDLVYGRNVLAYTDLTAAAEAPIVWTGRNAAGQGVALRALIWTNPHPGKVIRSLTAATADAAGSLMVLGITGLIDSTDRR